MKPIQTDGSDEALVTAIRANLCDFFRLLSRSNATEHFENDRFTRWYAPISYPWFNGVLCSDPPDERDTDFIAETIQYFRAKKVGTFTWWMEPQLTASDWQPALARLSMGFSDDTPGMAIELDKLQNAQSAVNGFEIRVVDDEESLQTWAKTFVKGYGLPSDWESPAFDLWRQLGLDLPIRNYLGYLNGTPVSTSSIFLGGGVAGIYCVSTLPEARGQGLGAALTLQPLLEACEWGYRIGVLQSSKMGFDLYKRLGFRQLCQIEYFYLSLL